MSAQYEFHGLHVNQGRRGTPSAFLRIIAGKSRRVVNVELTDDNLIRLAELSVSAVAKVMGSRAAAWDEGAEAQAKAYGMDKDTGPNPYREQAKP